MQLECRRFEFCPEVTAKALRLGYRILEVPVSYNARSDRGGEKDSCARWLGGLMDAGAVPFCAPVAALGASRRHHAIIE